MGSERRRRQWLARVYLVVVVVQLAILLLGCSSPTCVLVRASATPPAEVAKLPSTTMTLCSDVDREALRMINSTNLSTTTGHDADPSLASSQQPRGCLIVGRLMQGVGDPFFSNRLPSALFLAALFGDSLTQQLAEVSNSTSSSLRWLNGANETRLTSSGVKVQLLQTSLLWDVGVDAVQAGTLDIFVADTWITSGRLSTKDVDFSVAMWTEEFGLASLIPTLAPDVLDFRFMHPLEIPVWATLFAMLVFAGIVIFVSEWFAPCNRHIQTPLVCTIEDDTVVHQLVDDGREGREPAAATGFPSQPCASTQGSSLHDVREGEPENENVNIPLTPEEKRAIGATTIAPPPLRVPLVPPRRPWIVRVLSGLVRCIGLTFKLLVKQASHAHVKSVSSRFLMWMLAFFVIVMRASYTANLSSFLTVSGPSAAATVTNLLQRPVLVDSPDSARVLEEFGGSARVLPSNVSAIASVRSVLGTAAAMGARSTMSTQFALETLSREYCDVAFTSLGGAAMPAFVFRRHVALASIRRVVDATLLRLRENGNVSVAIAANLPASTCAGKSYVAASSPSSSMTSSSASSSPYEDLNPVFVIVWSACLAGFVLATVDAIILRIVRWR